MKLVCLNTLTFIVIFIFAIDFLFSLLSIFIFYPLLSLSLSSFPFLNNS